MENKHPKLVTSLVPAVIMKAADLIEAGEIEEDPAERQFIADNLRKLLSPANGRQIAPPEETEPKQRKKRAGATPAPGRPLKNGEIYTPGTVTEKTFLKLKEHGGTPVRLKTLSAEVKADAATVSSALHRMIERGAPVELVKDKDLPTRDPGGGRVAFFRYTGEQKSE